METEILHGMVGCYSYYSMLCLSHSQPPNSKLMVQEIQIDIVNADETIATDLQAITYVTLHVR